MTKKIEKDKIAREAHVAKYGHARRPVGVEMNGKIWMAFDGGIYQQVQDGPYNFLNAIHDHALLFFGIEMLDAEEAKEFSLRHPAIQWMNSFVDGRSQNGQNYQDGNGAAWFRFAYDLFTIRDNAKLQKDLRTKLLKARDFQAGRYELKVAAISATAGFDLQFEDERDNSQKHPEFIGTDRLTGAKIAVEAKSRHRKNVLGFGGGRDIPPGKTVGARGIILDAYEKQPKFPFYVFIDTNLPPSNEETMLRWECELEQTMYDLDMEGYASPCPANAIFFTNDPSHYLGGEPIGTYEGNLWVRAFTASEPKIPHPKEDMVNRLLIAHKQRVAPPTEFNENP